MSKEKGNDMTPNEINAAIAEIRGWIKFYEEGDDEGTGKWFWHRGNENLSAPPDYYHSLDACAEFERTMTDTRQMEAYVFYVKQIIGRPDVIFNLDYCMIVLPPQIKCEAFLRMHNKWRE